MVALHNQSETMEEERSGSAFLDRADCIYAGLGVRGENHLKGLGGKMRAGAPRAVMGGPPPQSQGHIPRRI